MLVAAHRHFCTCVRLYILTQNCKTKTSQHHVQAFCACSAAKPHAAKPHAACQENPKVDHAVHDTIHNTCDEASLCFTQTQQTQQRYSCRSHRIHKRVSRCSYSPIVSSGAAETAADDAYVFELVAWHTATVTQPRGAVSQSLCCFRNSATVADAPEFSFQLERKGVVFAASSTSTSFVARSRRLLLRAFLPSRFFLLGELQPERPEHNLRAPRPVQVARFPAVCCAADAVDPAADVAAAAHERKVWCGEKEWREKKRDEERENDTLMLAARQRRVELCIYVLRLRLHINFYKNLCGAFRDTQRLRDRLFCRDRKKPFSHAS